MGQDGRIEQGAAGWRGLVQWLRHVHRADYLVAKANDFRLFTRVSLLITGVFLCTTVIWDHAIDPVNARHAIGLRLIESLALFVWLAASWNDIRAPLARIAAVCMPLVVSLTFILVLSRLEHGAEYGIGGFLYFFIFMPFLLVGQSIRFAVSILGLISVFPMVVAPLGVSAGLDWGIYNAYVWMCFVPVVGIQLLCEYLYWRVSVYRGYVERLVVTDELTGLANRRRFFIESERILETHRRSQRRLSLLFIDIDHFKRINDTYGHVVGDAALCHVAEAIAQDMRGIDLMARYGGEEFLVLMPETSHRAALIAAERIRCAVRDKSFDAGLEDGRALQITVSIGVASDRPVADQTPQIDTLIQNADAAMYRAKQAGRDAVRGAADLSEPGAAKTR
ncbi:GGDEF domain-containing protein [Salinisphaera sp.]|uniref:GGDEF domain-containing protein n=1 Tax=Salinisphaera sp. TaxID=1914330 RepID=UPI000C42BDF0|nr:GGDEF domain-containing protein [Salinisphaera sp.]MBS63671.1 GGDEF domain-containing protein [Salinisphaera sp.]